MAHTRQLWRTRRPRECQCDRRREVARSSRWDGVVAAAAKVFRRHGFAKAQLVEIADELGMWKGSLYNYISTKEDLLTAVVEIPADRLITAAREIAESNDPPDVKLRGLVRCHVDVLVDIYDFAAVYLYEVAGRDLGPKWRKIDRQYTDLVEQVIVEGMALGRFR